MTLTLVAFLSRKRYQAAFFILLGDQQTENYRSWIRKNSELTEFLRIQLRIVVYFILPIALQQAEGSCTQHVLFFLLIVFLLIVIVFPGFGEHKCCPDGRWHR